MKFKVNHLNYNQLEMWILCIIPEDDFLKIF